MILCQMTFNQDIFKEIKYEFVYEGMLKNFGYNVYENGEVLSSAHGYETFADVLFQFIVDFQPTAEQIKMVVDERGEISINAKESGIIA